MPALDAGVSRVRGGVSRVRGAWALNAGVQVPRRPGERTNDRTRGAVPWGSMPGAAVVAAVAFDVPG
jgi:hypothetical protein